MPDNGLERCWYTFVPDTAASTVPVVVHLHGAGGCASLPAVGWGTLAQENGFAVVWPQGTRHPLPFLPDFLPLFLLNLLDLNLNSWNDGSGLFGAEGAGIDDVGFLEAMLSQITSTALPTDDSRSVNTDSARIYLSGHSNGATMAQRFALQTEGLIAAVIAVSGAAMPNDPAWVPGGTAISTYQPTPILLIAGTLDGVVPFNERRGPLAGAIPSFDGWGTINGCTMDSRTEEAMGDGAYTEFNFADCSSGAQVTLIQVFDAGHHPFPAGEEPFRISSVNVIASECVCLGEKMLYDVILTYILSLSPPPPPVHFRLPISWTAHVQ